MKTISAAMMTRMKNALKIVKKNVGFNRVNLNKRKELFFPQIY